jgi:cell division protein FtsL
LEEGRVRIALATLALVSSLILVAWRQSRALEALAALDAVRRERSLAEAEHAALGRRIEHLESRVRVVPEARARLGMHLPDVSSELRILVGELR